MSDTILSRTTSLASQPPLPKPRRRPFPVVLLPAGLLLLFIVVPLLALMARGLRARLLAGTPLAAGARRAQPDRADQPADPADRPPLRHAVGLAAGPAGLPRPARRRDVDRTAAGAAAGGGRSGAADG